MGSAALALLLAVGGIGLARPALEGEEDRPLAGADLERASAAALAYTGGGRVTETEADDEEGAYEVEVTLDDDRQIDVHLDETFVVISSEAEAGTDDD